MERKASISPRSTKLRLADQSESDSTHRPGGRTIRRLADQAVLSILQTANIAVDVAVAAAAAALAAAAAAAGRGRPRSLADLKKSHPNTTTGFVREQVDIILSIKDRPCL